MLLTFIAAAHPSLTHLLFALCFIERDESVFPFYCPAWPTLLPQWYIHPTAPAAQLMNRSMWPDAGTVTDFKFLFVGIQMRVPNRVSHSGWAVRGSLTNFSCWWVDRLFCGVRLLTRQIAVKSGSFWTSAASHSDKLSWKQHIYKIRQVENLHLNLSWVRPQQL